MTDNLMTKMQRISLFIKSFSKIYVYVTTGALLNYFIRLKEEYVYMLNVYILKYLLPVLISPDRIQ